MKEHNLRANRRLKVGIVGLEPGRSWASRSHVPALHALADTFEIAGVANTTKASSDAAARAAGLPAFADLSEMLESDVDIVAVTVKVPPHMQIVRSVVQAGKHVYCEWPLGNGLAQTKEMAALVRARGVLGVVGTQAMFAPEVAHMQALVADGYVGTVLSSTVVGRGGALQGGGSIPDSRTYAYLLDKRNGATLLTIPVGHFLSAARTVLGPLAEVSAVLGTRRPVALVESSGAQLPVTAPDQVLVSGLLASGAPLSLHYQGGNARDGFGLLWHITGTQGELRLSADSGHIQMVDLCVSGAQGSNRTFKRLNLPETDGSKWPAGAEAGNVARVYSAFAKDLMHGTSTAPNFDDAVANHVVVDAIERSAETGIRVRL